MEKFKFLAQALLLCTRRLQSASRITAAASIFATGNGGDDDMASAGCPSTTATWPGRSSSRRSIKW